ncbi:MAG TPA: hypothetical protein ENF81_01735 [Thermotogaceae bacterium]|nr:hypothetical protein [Thermotogota bacterium]HEW91251.1 hypothetical protein [Thermotogaceae bacterium]
MKLLKLIMPNVLKIWLITLGITLIVSLFNLFKMSDYLFIVGAVAIGIAVMQLYVKSKKSKNPLEIDKLGLGALIYSGLCFASSFLIAYLFVM